MSVHWPAFLRQIPQTPPLLSDFAQAEPGQVAVADGGASDIVQRLQDAAPDDRQDMMVAFLREQVRRILGLPSIDQVDPYTALSEMGMDSLMAVELKNALDEAVGKNLPATIAFEYPTIDALAGYLLTDVLPLTSESSEDTSETTSPEAPETTAESEDEIALPDLDDLSEEELEALLMEKLDDFDDLEDV